MIWKVDFESDKDCVWLSDDKFIHLFPVDGVRWGVRIGVKNSKSQNQERIFKNRSRAMISVQSLMKSRSLNLSE